MECREERPVLSSAQFRVDHSGAGSQLCSRRTGGVVALTHPHAGALTAHSFSSEMFKHFFSDLKSQPAGRRKARGEDVSVGAAVVA